MLPVKLLLRGEHGRKNVARGLVSASLIAQEVGVRGRAQRSSLLQPLLTLMRKWRLRNMITWPTRFDTAAAWSMDNGARVRSGTSKVQLIAAATHPARNVLQCGRNELHNAQHNHDARDCTCVYRTHVSAPSTKRRLTPPNHAPTALSEDMMLRVRYWLNAKPNTTAANGSQMLLSKHHFIAFHLLPVEA